MSDRQQFLYAEDLIHNGRFNTAKVTIEEVIPPDTLRSADKKLIDKTTLRFVGKDKLLILCKTNEQVLRYVTGEGPERWAGHRINIQARTVQAFGSETVALRVMPTPGQKIRKAIADRLGKPAELHIERMPEPEPTTPRDEFDAAYAAAEQDKENGQ